MEARDGRWEEVHWRWQARPRDALAAARAWLSALAGAQAAAGLHRDVRGRPRLAPGAGDVGWSHTGDGLLLAWTPRGRIGVDAEHADRHADALRIARRYFRAEECAQLAALAPRPRRAHFLRLWCAKEAVLKAHGHGLAFGLHRLTVAAGGDAPRLLACDPALGDAAGWRLHLLAPDPAHVAVIARHDGILAP